jgi:hypothetical protein
LGAIGKVLGKEFRLATKGMFRKFGSSLGEGIGGSYGYGNAGRRIGGAIGQQMARITGFGDYTVENNTLLKPTVVPDFGLNSVRITHKEYLGNIMGSEQFAGTVYQINPGLSQTFPWLSGIARNYQQYRINGMIFQYVSTSAYALGTTNSALGKVILATNYNAEDPPFSATTEMLATQFSTYCRPADSIMHAIECARNEVAQNLLYVRTDLDDASKDKRITDLGFTEVAREGMQSTSEVGGLWISYDVTLMKPILNPQNAMSDGFDQFVMSSQVDDLYDSKITPRNNYLGGEFVSVMGGFVYNFADTISSGTFLSLIEFDLPASTLIDQSGGGPYGTFTNCEVVIDDDKNGPFNGAYLSPATPQQISTLLIPGSESKNSAVIIRVIKVTGPQPGFSLTNLNLTGPGIFWRFNVFPISYSSTPQVEGP